MADGQDTGLPQTSTTEALAGTQQLPERGGAAPNPQATQDASQQQMQQLMMRLMGRIAQPRMQGPGIPPTALQQAQPRYVEPNRQIAQTRTEGSQLLTQNLFGLIANISASHKQAQVNHAVSRIMGINDAIETAYELAGGDQEKAKQIFMADPRVKALQSKEGQKDIKQMEKLLQWDFLNPEKKKTVWHEALGKVVQITGAEKAMKGVQALFGKHQDKMAQQQQTANKEFQGSQEAGKLAQGMFKQARPETPDPAKILPALTHADAQLQLEQLRQVHRVELESMREQHQDVAGKLKNPVDQQIAKGYLKMEEADRLRKEGDEKGAQAAEADAQKMLDRAHQGSLAKKSRAETLTNWINQSITGSPKEKETAEAEIKKYESIQDALLSKRGLAFGMGRMMQYTDDDGVLGQPGGTAVLNGFQLMDLQKGTGGHFTMIGNINPNTELAMQQVIRTSLPALQALESDLPAYDNANDRAIIARVLRANPEVRNMDETSLGVWIDQNLTKQLSPKGQSLMQHIAIASESLGRVRTLSGQTSTGMNTQLILGMLPDERTPNSEYGKAKIQNLYNFINGITQVPLLGGERTKKLKGGGKATDVDTILDDLLPPDKAKAAKP